MLRIIRERVLPKIGPWSIAGFVAVCLAAAAAIFGLSRLRSYVASLSEFDINVASITIADPPAWAPRSLGAEIRAAMPGKANIFDRDLTREVYKSCRSLYWVEQIDSVRKVYPNTLELKMKLRTPVAYVRYGGEPYLTDRKGRRLPNHYYRKPDGVPNLLDIKGIGGTPPEPGAKWGDCEALTAAIAVVEDIANTELCRRTRITTVDAGNFNGRKDITYSHIVLWTENQTQILWIRSSKTKEYGDLSTKEKLDNLNMALQKYDLSKLVYANVGSVRWDKLEPNRYPVKYRIGGR